jgi:glycerate dehydrogenase
MPKGPDGQADRPSIVVLDGDTLAPTEAQHAAETGSEEPNWNALSELGRLRVYARTPPELTLDRARGASIVLTNKTVLSRAHLEQLSSLRYIGVLATGTDTVDLAAAKALGIVVTNVPSYSTESVVQHTFALLLALVSKTAEYNAAVHAGRWTLAPDFSLRLFPTREISGRLLGIVGLGAIGGRVAQVARAFGMRIAAAHRPRGVRPEFGRMSILGLGLDDLFAHADVVTLHCPLTAETRGLVSAARLALMKPGSLLINTARGALIDEVALAEALNRGTPAGAALDVLSQEPPPAENPLLTAPRCLITPHVAWTTLEARQRLMAKVVDNVRQFLGRTDLGSDRP